MRDGETSLTDSKGGTQNMKIQEIKGIAKQHGIKAIAVKNLKKD